MEKTFWYRTPGAKGTGHNENSKIIKIVIILASDYGTPIMYQTYRAVYTCPLTALQGLTCPL